jgi:hypothetical protein
MTIQDTIRPALPLAGTTTSGTTRAGVGYSEQHDSRQAAIEAAKAAMANAGLERCDLVLLFATDKHDPPLLRDGLRTVVGPEPRLIGGASMGVITADRLGYEGHQVGVAVISSDTMKMNLFSEAGLPDNEFNVGRALGQQIMDARFDGDPNLLLLYDIVKERTTEGLSLNMATPLLAGMSESFGAAGWPSTAGCGLMGSLQWNPGFQWFDDRIEQHHATAVVFHGGVRMDTTIVHGCQPSGGYHTITKADGNCVLELDGEPMLDVIARLAGNDDASGWKDYPLFITLGINHGDQFGPYRQEDYAVRLCMAVDAERRGLLFFGDDLQAGTVVQLMRRSLDVDYIRTCAESLLAQAVEDGRRPFLALYIDCAGRAAMFAGTEREEAEEVQRVVGSQVPLLGWYVGCEIGRAGKVMESHNWTGVLSILSE